ncbi:MAG: DEAD/DEAH box helicase [Anaerolineae bacterium]
MNRVPVHSRERRTAVEPLAPGAVDGPLAEIMSAMHVDIGHQVAYVGNIPPREPSYALPDPPLPNPLIRALRRLEITRLFSHQTEALRLAREGQDLVVVTSTSSGKTLCYNLPVLERILGDRAARALYIYPINALVNDQFNMLARINLELGQNAVGIDRYSGSVTSDRRKDIRERQPNILLTNPEMVHLSFLQWHSIWATLWKNLSYVILDEVHTYRGVFGAHMAGLVRRLLRVAHYYGANPQFICCSATIANPQDLVENLTSRPCTVVDRDGSASGRRLFVLWNPPLDKNEGENVRRSYADESVDLLQLCLREDLNTIVFTRARAVTERMLRQSQGLSPDAVEIKDEPVPQIASYRAGYLAEEREAIETRLKLGELRGVITTNALELGIDIGGLDSAIIAGYPGSIMSTWQQAGRAGRRGKDALVFLVASQNPLDQFYMLHPEQFFDEPHEQAVVDLANPFVRLRHLLCSAREVPWILDEIAYEHEDTRRDLAALKGAGILEEQVVRGRASLAYPGDDKRKGLHMQLSLRSAGQTTYAIRDEQRHEVGSIQPPNVFREAHPGAIYQHIDGDYRVLALNTYEHTVTVRPESLPHYTRSQSASSISVSRELVQRPLGLDDRGPTVHLGEVVVTEVVSAYQELEMGSNRLVRRVNLEKPLRIRLHTTGLWISLPPQLEQAMPGLSDSERRTTLEYGLHAVQHLLTGLVPLLVMCDRRDIGGESSVKHPDVGRSALFLYDAYEGGIGLAEAAYQQVERLLALAHDTVRSCSCSDGCPACIQSSNCRRGNEALDKQAAIGILAQLTIQFADSDAAARTGRQQLAGGLSRSLERAIEEIDQATIRRGLVSRSADAADAEPELAGPAYAVGTWVHHAVYGRGIVIETDGTGNAAWVTVRFVRRSVIQRISAKSAQLKPEPGQGKKR